MDPFAFGGYQTRELALLHQRKALEQEISDIKERQRRVQRHQRRQIIVKQVQQLEDVLKQVQNANVPGSRVACIPVAPTPTARDERSPSVEWMLIKLMQQNEELLASVKNQRTDTSDRMYGNPQPQAADTSHWKSQPSTPSHSSQVKTTETLLNNTQEEVRPRTKQAQSPVRGWSMIDDLPEVEWTDKDEELLEQLLRGQVDQTGGMLALPGVVVDASLSIGEGDSDLANILNRKQQHQDRQDSRRKLAQLFDTSAMSNSTGIRRPRWRIEQDITNGVVQPFGESGEGAIGEQPMPALQVFRSAVIAVMSMLELQHLLYEKKLRLRVKSLQDFEPMLNLYFDATRVWLGKLVKTPLLSIVQDASLDIDVSTKAGLFRAPEGISKWFGASRSIVSIAALQNSSSAAEHSRAVKLKVRVKGIIDAIVKAIEKGDVPGGIQDFWKRLTTEGIYFPATYPLFEMERQALDLDELGATRSTQDDYVAPLGQTYPRFQIILANFVLLRVLVPHVVIRPWEIGVGNANPPKAVSANLKNVASLLYAILARLSPLPAVGVDVGSGTRGALRRRSVEVVPITEPIDTAPSSPDFRGNNQDKVTGDAKRFLSITAIHGVLIPEKVFPLDHFELFIIEQQQRVREVLRGLHARLHPRACEEEMSAT